MADPSHPLVELTLVRLRDFYREPATIFWVFGFPLVLALGLGLAFRNRPPEPVRVIVAVDEAAPSWIVPLLSPPEQGADSGAAPTPAAPLFEVRTLPEAEAVLALRRGQGDVLVQALGEHAWRARWDETRPESRLARLVVERALERGRGRGDVLRAQDENVVEPGSRYIDFLLPGLVGMNLMGSSMWGVGWAIVDARKKKLLKRLAATPMRRQHYLGSLLIARLIFLVAEVVALLLVGRFAFGVSVQGSHVAVMLLSPRHCQPYLCSQAVLAGATLLARRELIAAAPLIVLERAVIAARTVGVADAFRFRGTATKAERKEAADRELDAAGRAAAVVRRSAVGRQALRELVQLEALVAVEADTRTADACATGWTIGVRLTGFEALTTICRSETRC